VDAALKLNFTEATEDPSTLAAGVGMFILPETATDKPGFAVLLFATDGFQEATSLTDNLTLEFKGEVDLTGGVGIFVRPNQDITFFSGLASGAPVAVGGNLLVSLRLGQPGTPIVLLGNPEGSRLECGGVSTTAGARFDNTNKFEVLTEFALEGGKIVIKPAADDTDGFLSHLLPSQGFELDFGLVVGFSTKRGLYFAGSGGFTVRLPANLKLGPLTIVSGILAVRFGQGSLPIDIAADLRAELGPVTASAEEVGMTADLTFPGDRKGNLGIANLGLKFKPPTGIGIEVDAGPVTGGGFLSLDFDAGRYSGAVELSVYSVAVKAFGIIETKFPDGHKGFSFIIIISAEFTPIQLGFGFTLLGVGGIIGINRTLNQDGLTSIIRSHGLDNVLFPSDPVGDAPAIIADLATIFPAADGHYVFGPMAKLGWGMPTLIDAEIGVVLVLPGPVLAVLGEVHCVLPTASFAWSSSTSRWLACSTSHKSVFPWTQACTTLTSATSQSPATWRCGLAGEVTPTSRCRSAVSTPPSSRRPGSPRWPGFRSISAATAIPA
jgi:hypothetical protein